MIRYEGVPRAPQNPKTKREDIPTFEAVKAPAKVVKAREAVSETESQPPKSNRSNRPQSNAGQSNAGQSNAGQSNVIAFDKKAYQRDLMRKRRADVKQKATAKL